MHTTLFGSVILLVLTGALAQSHDGLLKQNHHAFMRVKRAGGVLHLVGDETVAQWNGGSVAGLPKPSVVAPISVSTSYTNLMDSINAGLGVPAGRPTASPSSSSLPSSSVATTTSSPASSSIASSPSAGSAAKSSSAKASTSAKSTSSKAKTTSSAKATSSKAAAAAVKNTSKAAAAAAAAKPSASAGGKRSVNATVSHEVDEAHIQALGRRAAGNSTVPIDASASSTDSASSANTTDSATSAPSFSAAELSTSQGWGATFASKYSSMSVNNHAVRGASARSVYRDMWAAILSSVKGGDLVLLQLGHYDSLMPGSSQDTAEGCIGSMPGSGPATMTVTSGCTGAQEVVQTFYGYVSSMCKDVQAKGATCMVASLTPKNKFSGNNLNYNSPYTSQAQAAASAAGGIYVPHLETIGKQVNGEGIAIAQNYWMSGNALQSNAAGADAFASAFVAAASCAGVSGLSLTDAGKAVAGGC